jgi:transposase
MKNSKLYCGLDVHKDSIFACIVGKRFKTEVKQFGTTTYDITELKRWLQSFHVGEVAMESTGIYWMPIWRLLENDFGLKLVNPYFIKQMPGRKSDVQDAQWIATLLMKGMLKGSYVPGKNIRVLRSYERRYVHLCGQMNRCVQQIERQLSLCNIKICNLTSQIESQTVLKVVEKIIAGETSAEQLALCVHGRIRNKHGKKVIHSLEGMVEEHDRYLLSQIYDDYLHLTKQMQSLVEQMEMIAEKFFSEQTALLKTMRGVQKLAAIFIIAETGGDMRYFPTARHLCSWAGLRPRNDESAGKMKSTAITKGNKYLRRIMVQTAWAASRTKGSFLQNKFQQLCVRKSTKKALIAIARKQLVIVWNVLSKKENYKEFVPVLSEEKRLKKLDYYQQQIQRLQTAAH